VPSLSEGDVDPGDSDQEDVVDPRQLFADERFGNLCVYCGAPDDTGEPTMVERMIFMEGGWSRLWESNPGRPLTGRVLGR
jgi:hypothetical protein